MKIVLQRASEAQVIVEKKKIAEIGQGIVAFIAVLPEDTVETAKKAVDKLLKFRIFSDNQDKMNLSVADIQGGLLLISQFTLAAVTNKGNRPDFKGAAPAEQAEKIYHHMIGLARNKINNVQHGQFAADMKIHINNDGPATFLLCIH